MFLSPREVIIFLSFRTQKYRVLTTWHKTVTNCYMKLKANHCFNHDLSAALDWDGGCEEIGHLLTQWLNDSVMGLSVFRVAK